MRILDPKKIEEKSFEIIEGLLKGMQFPPGEKEIIKRVIHTSTDPAYAKEMRFHPRAVEAGLGAIRAGRDIFCDVGMVQAGINKRLLSQFGGKVVCLINDEDVIKEAAEKKITRAILAMRKAVPMMEGAIVSIGNAPTALFELCDLIKSGKARPALIIGIPVGFVGAVESKEELTASGIPFITNSSTKGGSNIAAAITNALLKLTVE